MGFDVVVNISAVGLMGGWSDFQLGIVFEPHIHPLTQRVLSSFDDIQTLVFLYGSLQLLLGLCLSLTQHILVNGFSIGIMARCVSACPPSIFPLSDTSVTIKATDFESRNRWFFFTFLAPKFSQNTEGTI